MDKNKKKYRDIHGTTRVGDFLRKIKKSGLIGKAVDAAGSLATGDVLGALQTVLTEDNTISPEDKSYALEQLRLDIEAERGITQRWTADLRWGNTLTKVIRPMILIVLVGSYVTGFFMKYPLDNISGMVSIVLTAYFGSRGAEKIFGKER
jgi:hypothetical protein